MPKCLTHPAAEPWALRWKNRRVLRSLKSTWNEIERQRIPSQQAHGLN